jgi:tRNA uridine 5-carbamoylmethylation protein Kti12
MPSLIITGHPSIGKSSFTKLLSSRAISHHGIKRVVHITESSACHLPKNECYANSHTEKETRAALKSAFDSAVAATNNSSVDDDSTLVILDSLNYIKGYRYELYCISKAAGQRHGVVWIMGSKSDEEPCSGSLSRSDLLAKKHNRDRCQSSSCGDYYEENMMDELVARYEPPDERNRWEDPLYKVNVSSVSPWDENGTLEGSTITNYTDSAGDEVIQQMEAVKLQGKDEPTKPVKSASGFKRNKKVKLKPTTSTTQSVSSLVEPPLAHAVGPISIAARNLINTNDNSTSVPNHPSKTTTVEQTVDSILSSFLSIQPLKQGMSTANHSSAESDVLNKVDAITQRVNSDIIKIQTLKSNDISGRISISTGTKQQTLKIQQQLNSNELRNLRTQFLKWTVSHPSGSNEDGIVESYLAYIESSIIRKD